MGHDDPGAPANAAREFENPRALLGAGSIPGAITRGFVWMVAFLGVAAGGLALWKTLGGERLADLPAVGVIGGAALLYGAGMVVYGQSGAVLLSDRSAAAPLRLRFLVSQPAKYLPGGFAQPLGQIVVSADVADSPVRAAAAVPVHVAVNVVSASVLALPVVWWSEVPTPIKWAAALAPLSLVVLFRPVLVFLVRLLGSVIRQPFDPDSVPPHSATLEALAFGVASHGLMAGAFALLVSSVVSAPGIALVGSYAAAWLIGYVAVPFPAGVGAREAALIFLLSSTATAATVISVAIMHRIITIVVELLLMAVSMVRLGRYGVVRFAND